MGRTESGLVKVIFCQLKLNQLLDNKKKLLYIYFQRLPSTCTSITSWSSLATRTTWCQYLKPFLFVTDAEVIRVQEVLKFFYFSLIFVGKQGAYTNSGTLPGAPLSLLANIKLAKEETCLS